MRKSRITGGFQSEEQAVNQALCKIEDSLRSDIENGKRFQTQDFEDILKCVKDVNAKNPEGKTLLHIACELGINEFVKFLINKGAEVNVNARNPEGKTFLHIACELGIYEFVKFLINKGAEVNAVDQYGNTPAHYTAENINEETSNHFQTEGAEFDKRGNNRAHFEAVLKVNREILEFLIKKNADPDIKNQNKKTFLDLIDYVDENQTEQNGKAGDKRKRPEISR